MLFANTNTITNIHTNTNTITNTNTNTNTNTKHQYMFLSRPKLEFARSAAEMLFADKEKELLSFSILGWNSKDLSAIFQSLRGLQKNCKVIIFDSSEVEGVYW